MLYALSTRHQKKIACAFLLLFYADIVLAGAKNGYRGSEWENKRPSHGMGSFPVILEKGIYPKKQVPSMVKKGTGQKGKRQETLIDTGAGLLLQGPGPGQPEMQSFKSIGTDNMVDLFTGDFSYNIPLLDVGGYPVNIFYNSGISMDQEASWTGLGWNINPGTISRNMRGLPDDFNGIDKVTKTQSIKDNVTVGASVGGKLELTGFPMASLSVSGGIFYNNYKGFGVEAGFGLSISDKTKDDKTSGVSPTAGLGYKVNSQTGATISPSLGIDIYNKDNETHTGITASVGYNSRTGIQNLQLAGEMSRYGNGKQAEFLAGSISFAKPSVTPSIRMPISRSNYNLGFTLGGEVFLGMAGLSVSGYYTNAGISGSDMTQVKPAYGYLHMQRGQLDDNALMDFNRVNDGVFTQNTPVISMPNYTYDVYSMSGEGTGGSFRPYRGDIGYVKDHYTKTRDNSFSLDGEYAPGPNVVEIGGNIHAVFAPTEVQEWKTGNLARNALRFHGRDNNDGNDSTFQPVYFKNPSEKTIGNQVFTEAMGGEDLVKIKLSNTDGPYPNALPVLDRYSDNRQLKGTSVLSDTNTVKKGRDRRSQVISYLTAEEASKIGLDRDILSYPLNTFPIGGCGATGIIVHTSRYESPPPQTTLTPPNRLRLSHHISEIDVLNGDGRRYIYGLPAYNIAQDESSFATNSAPSPDAAGQTAQYDFSENSTRNTAGHDHYYQKESVPAFAHTFLLTGLLSPDYMDVKGDGITEDDMGDAVKFNYTQIRKPDGTVGFNWRAPLTNDMSASFSESLKTDSKDNKASYTFGQRELWYMNSIESKNMIATFTILERSDGREAQGTNGGINTAAGMKRLDHIDLYAKADRIKYGNAARPIKTVHFEYSYELCKGAPSNGANGGGKLTLKSIWFSYNGNNKQVKNRYVFNYGNNPSYDRSANDRWGSYKPIKDPDSHAATNLGGMNNSDYPYSTQDRTLADRYASAWTLDQVQLPSGGKIDISYEADDYAYVQDRRAAQMFKIAGFGSDMTSSPSNNLYQPFTNGSDKPYVFIDTKVANNTPETAKRYFEGIKQIYLKMFVKVPSDAYGGGYEAIPAYAEILEYGVVPGNGQLLYLKVRSVEIKGKAASPMASAAIEFLRDYLPSKAFPGSDLKENNGPMQYLLALNAMVVNVLHTFTDFENGTARGSNYCNDIDLGRSFIRLNNPDFHKKGGGLRVRKVAISDNFNRMTQKTDASGNVVEAGMQTATYGQEYDYITTANINGAVIPISSGVATYEPGIGAEENPFREILHYSDTEPLGPTQTGAIEVPIGEMFYPSPMVGYSRVTVRSINRDTVKSGVGSQVTEFYTSRDFPVRSDYTDLDPASRVRFKSNPILEILHLDTRQTMTLSQGFRVQINDMNGKVRTQASYGEDSTKLISYTANYYRMKKKTDGTYSLDNNVLATTGSDGKVSETQIGREVEMMADFREHSSETVTKNIDLNVNASIFGIFPIIVPSIVPPIYFEQSLYRSASVVKIINSYGILDSVVSIDKGSQVSTKDLLYDGETGNALLTRTNNEFNDPVYNFSYPAHWAYTGMRPAYGNIDLAYANLKFRYGKLEENPLVNMANFESGDEIYAVDQGGTYLDDTQPCAMVAVGNACSATAPKITKTFIDYRLWALDITKDRHNGPRQFLFMDRNGIPYTADNVNIRVVRSGKRNLLNQSVGSVTSRLDPLRYVDGKAVAIVPSDNNDIVNTAAATFKDNWRVDNAFYLKDSLVRNFSVVYPRSAYLYFDRTNFYGITKHSNGNSETTNEPNQSFFEARRQSFGDGAKSHYQYVSWAHIDLANLNIPINSTILSATLNLVPHYATHNNTFEDPNFVHDKTNPQAFPTNGGNVGVLRRMTTPWYPDRSPLWGNNLLDDNEKIIESNTTDNVTESLITANNGDVTNPQTLYSSDITEMIKAMLRDKANASSNATGFRLHIFDQQARIDPTRLGFDRMTVNFGGKNIQTTYVDLQYVSCNQPGGTIELNPITGQYECSYYQNSSICLSTFDRKQMNPYVQGVLGNWRTERAYTYYGSRRESVASPSAINLRNAGAINNFLPFWAMDRDSLRTPKTVAQNSVWTWNSEITQFNRRGFEIENHDPLGRYNSGLYGYGQALPTAVANSAKRREIGFDGFEDYGYTASPCAGSCQPHRQMNISNLVLASDTAHTGKYSLRVMNGNDAVIKAPVVDSVSDMAPYSLKIKMDSSSITKISVNPRGTGLLGHYYSGWYYLNVTPPDRYNYTQYDNNVIFNWGNNNAPGGLPSGDFSIRWKAEIQPTISGDYQFGVVSDDGTYLYLDSTNQPTSSSNMIINDWRERNAAEGYAKSQTIRLTAGKLYYLTLEYHDLNRKGAASVRLSWWPPCQNGPVDISPNQFYPPGHESDTTGTTHSQIYWCVKPDSIALRGNALTDTLSPVRGRQMVVSAWVREGGTDCKCNGYTNNNIQVLFPGSNQNNVPSMVPAGNIIEGWQRYEGLFTVPVDATQMEIHMKNNATDGRAVYFDDVRIHPYNGNMKSFVYHPSNLRLMAELDENNYASFYEYDDDGTLVRVKKETVKGVMTISETRSSLQKNIQ